MAKPKAALLDLYGTVLIRPHCPNPIKTLITELGFSGAAYDRAWEDISTRPDVESAADVVRILDPQKLESVDIAKYERLLEESISDTRPVPETRHVLTTLKERGVLLGVISNVAAPLKRPFYNHGLDHYLPTMVFSCDVGYRKPRDIIYKIAFDKMRQAAASPVPLPPVQERRPCAQADMTTEMVLTPEAPFFKSHLTRLRVKPLRRDEIMVFGDSMEKDYAGPRRAALPAMMIDRSKGMDLYTMLDVFCNGNVAAHGRKILDYP